ncbi:hypothetical protein BPOR_1242g00010 [Botrytis porri]|uniref:Uncharacterized protein n=1 Tax=Botrytis porri TaxID=87229 RepID=A0A4Z1KAR9_9HELO|nr:hypothetical protein BPOR_1242g00010 [Botrytis porri]
MSSRKGKEIDKKRTDSTSSTHTRRPCSAKGSDGKWCPGDGKYDSSKGKICRACYDKFHCQATVGNVASSSKIHERSSQRSSPSVSPHSSTAQKHSHRIIEAGTRSHNVGAPSNKGKRPASRTPSSEPPSPKRYPVSPDLTGFGISESLDSSSSLQVPAYGQTSYSAEYEQYQPPQPPQIPNHPRSPDNIGNNKAWRDMNHINPEPTWYPRSPDIRGFTAPETELAPCTSATRVVEQPFTQSLDAQKIQYPNREYDEGDLYSADTPPPEIRQPSSLTSAPQRRPPVEVSKDTASQRKFRPWESGYSSETHNDSRSHHSTTTAGGEGSSRFNRMPKVSEIQSQMRSTSIEDPNIIATYNVMGSYDQMPSTSHAPLSSGAGPSSSRLPEVTQGVLQDEHWEYERKHWDLNEYETQRQYLDRYLASNPISEAPEELRAHLLFAMSFGEGLICTY